MKLCDCGVWELRNWLARYREKGVIEWGVATGQSKTKIISPRYLKHPSSGELINHWFE